MWQDMVETYDCEEDEDAKDACDAGEAKGVGQRHAPEHDGELLMCERQGPETEVGGCVRNAVQAEF